MTYGHLSSAAQAAPRLHAQRGQALIFTLFFAAVTLVVALVLYNSGKLANTKTQLQNAADAGAYSAAVLLARDRNFSAYTNRAMVANQVSVAQLVSLKSYLDDAKATRTRMGEPLHQEVAATVPVFKPSWTIASAIPIQAVASAYAVAAPLAVKALDGLIKVIDLAQEAHHDATAAEVSFVANEVVKRNDPDAAVSMMSFQIAYRAEQIREWVAYTRKHAANDASAAADRFANVVVDAESTDELVRRRDSKLVAGWVSMPTELACPGLIPFLTLYYFQHKGGTILSSSQRRWLALDATQGIGGVSCFTEVGIPVAYPLLQDGFGGNGGALAGTAGGYGERRGFAGNPDDTNDYGDALNGLTAEAAAARYAKGPGTSLDANGGLQDYYRDVAATDKLPANQSAVLNGADKPFTIEVRREADTIRTSSKVVGTAPANVKADAALKGNVMRVMASGAAYFYRPTRDSGAFTRAGWARADKRTEMVNLFNPYWQAQLVENPTGALAASLAEP